MPFQQSRRDFLAAVTVPALAAVGAPSLLTSETRAADAADRVAFFLVGDTHYLANKEKPSELDATSRAVTSRFIETLNRLPGTDISEAAGGGKVIAPRGVIHCGDVIDTGDKNGSAAVAMQQTEWAAFEADFGLKGTEGKLKLPVFEVHGNHDSPGGQGLAINEIKRRNQQRAGLANVSDNGLHYSWNWGGVHFVNLGIVVGGLKEVTRRRRYAPLDSLPFLADDLARNAKDGQPVVLTHHVDVARYSDVCNPTAAASNGEWDACDVQAYFELVKKHRIAAVLYGHTHARSVYRWDGSKSTKQTTGIPVFNNDNSAHFNSVTQAFLYFEISDKELLAREYSTPDAWQTGGWSPTSWRVAFA